jgi:hypothetical protein
MKLWDHWVNRLKYHNQQNMILCLQKTGIRDVLPYNNLGVIQKQNTYFLTCIYELNFELTK